MSAQRITPRILRRCMAGVALSALFAMPLAFSFYDNVPRSPALIFMDAIHDLSPRDHLSSRQSQAFDVAIKQAFEAQLEEKRAQARFEVKLWALVAALASLNYLLLRRLKPSAAPEPVPAPVSLRTAAE